MCGNPWGKEETLRGGGRAPRRRRADYSTGLFPIACRVAAFGALSPIPPTARTITQVGAGPEVTNGYTFSRPAFGVGLPNLEALYVKANVSAEQPPPGEAPRLPHPHADARGPRHRRAPPVEGPGSAIGIAGTTGRNLVRRILSTGRAFHGDRVIVFVVPGSGTVAFVAGRRVGGAVNRNRARRILRAAWREVAPEVGDGFDVALVARARILETRTHELVTEVAELLARAQVTAR